MAPKDRPLISSARCEVTGTHCCVTVWNRGQNAGMLIVDADDASELLVRLVQRGCQTIDGNRVTRWALAEATVQREGYTITATQDDDDRGLVRIALDGKTFDTVSWEGDHFGGRRWVFTPVEAENDAAREALETAYANALAHLPEPI